MKQIQNYYLGNWHNPLGATQVLYNAVNGEPIGEAGTQQIDFEPVFNYARNVGNSNLRKLTFQQRGRMLKALALYLTKNKEKYYALSYQTGATRADSWVDIEGGIGNLFVNASLRRKLPDTPFTLDGDVIKTGKEGNFIGHHLLTPKEGVAVHINAYNFPVWGMLEKIAVNFLAGMPAIVKPAPATAYLTELVVKDIIESEILPEGALQLFCGDAQNMLDFVDLQDVVTFTGSAATGQLLKKHPTVIANSVPLNIEADSLNALVLGTDVSDDMPEWDLFIKEVRREITSKAGQKCTAVRRILVPANKLEQVQNDLAKALSQTTVGNPLNPNVKMGSLAGLPQRQRLQQNINELLKTSSIVYGNIGDANFIDADSKKGAFVNPLLLLNQNPYTNTATHNIEAFGPVSTLMPYDTIENAVEIANMGKGSLVTSIVTNNPSVAKTYVLEAAPYHGRILILNRDAAKENTGHGSPLPTLVHGGPGRAGGGEEMGGLRGIKHYLQRTAIQGSPSMISAITEVFQPNAAGISTNKHPFTQYFEDLQIGEQLITDKKEITAEGIDAFAALSGDHFYAHKRETDFADTMFTEQVAHGYYLMSLAAGLFVHSFEKNPVLLNYGIDEMRFTKPVYAGSSIYVRFTAKEKIAQELKDVNPDIPMVQGQLIPKGIVKWLVEILDDTDELVGIGTILTMVEMKAAVS